MTTLLPARYSLGSILGEGAMGRVYAARDGILGADVAVKVVRSDLASDLRFRERFEAEVRLAARTVHPHLVPLHDTGVTPDGAPWLAMARADSGSLADFRGGWDELLGLALDVLDALGALHARGVLHRDLKPGNVLVHQGRAWVADLGIAELMDRLGRTGRRIAGSPAYMPPEQRAGETWRMGPWTDLFALGRTLDELTAGRPVPKGLDQVLATLLDPEPLARFALAADARRALLALGPAEAVRQPSAAPSTTSGMTWGAWTVVDDAPLAGASTGEAARSAMAGPPLAPDPPDEPGRGARARASLALFALRELPLVGREAERRALWDEAAAVRASGKPRVVLLVGEAGAGKSRLAGSVARALEEGGHAETIAVRHHDPPARDDGLRGSARRDLRVWGSEPREAVQEHVARRLRVDEAEAAGVLAWLDGQGDAGRRWLLAELRSRASRGLCVLWLDDVARAAPNEGLGLVSDLLAGDPLPVLILVGIRSDDLAHAGLAGAMERLLATGARRLLVPRLDLDATEALLGEALTLDPDVAHLLAHRCQGNPSFARQILLDWCERGVLVDTGGLHYRVAAGVDVREALPSDAEDLLARRVEALVSRAADPQDARRRLHRLALAGPHLPRDLASRLDPPDAAAELLSDGHVLRWENALAYDTLLRQALARPDSAVLHGELADVWAEWRARTGAAVSGAVGQHRLLAGDAHGAREPLRQAIRDGNRSSDGTTRALREAAIVAADRAGDRLASGLARVWVARLDLYRDPAEARRRAEEALERLEGDGWAQAHAWFALSTLHHTAGRIPAARSALEAGVAAARATPGSDDVLALLLTSAGRLHFEEARNEEGAAVFAEALELGRRLGLPTVVADALYGLATAARLAGDSPRARALLAESRERFAALGNASGVVTTSGGLAHYDLRDGNVDSAEEMLATLASQLRASGDVVQLQRVLLDLAQVHRHKGDLEAARQLLWDVLRWTEAVGRSPLLVRGNLLFLEISARDFASAQAHADAIGTPAAWAVPHVLCGRAAAAAGLGRQEALGDALGELESLGFRAESDAREALLCAQSEALARGWTDLAARARDACN